MSLRFTVVLDPGHGGHDSGAVNGTTGAREKDVVLADCTLLGQYLNEAGMLVVDTRGDDEFVSLTDRAALANEVNAALVSLHCNASNGRGYGFEAFTSPGQTDSDVLATMLLEDYAEKVAEKFGLRARYDLQDGDPDKEARFAVLTQTKGVAVLFELGFIDNVNDEKFLTSQKARELRCRVLADSIINWATEVHGFKPRNSQSAKMVAGGRTDRSDVTYDDAQAEQLSYEELEAANAELSAQLDLLKAVNELSNSKIEEARKALG